MFGVLVVSDPQGRVGFIRAVSGMLGAEWNVAGLVPPAFDLATHDAEWPGGQVRVDALEAARHALRDSGASLALRHKKQGQDRRHQLERAELNDRHHRRRSERAHSRAELTLAERDTASELAVLEEASRADKRERKEMRALHAQEVDSLALRLGRLDDELARRKAESVALCNELLAGVRSRYHICNAQGECRSLVELFAPDQPPGGTGDCAGPKLLCYAHRSGLRPLAMAEFWWGAAPAGGGRHSGQYYPACRGKCAPLLEFMLGGLSLEAAPSFATEMLDDDQPVAIFEDEHLIVVNKPPGMLSVPGRSPALRDSALTRLQQRSADPDLPLSVHRLDLDTSGLLLFAKSRAAHRELSRLFAERKVEKHYLAWLVGELSGQGRIDLPLRVDLDDRPRQIVDHRHGKPSQTEYQVLGQEQGFTRVRLTPRTGRTHQLRVHCAHSRGLGAAIVGDRLYGKPASRLLLHAEFLAFVHPITGLRLELRCPAPAGFGPATNPTNY